MADVPYTYNLTELVGRRAEEGRTMIVASFEVQKRHLVIFLAAFIPALIVALVAGTIIGVYGILVFFAVQAAAFYLVERRTSDGLHLRTWESLQDKRIADTGKVFICRREVDPAAVEIINVVGRTVPVGPRDADKHTPIHISPQPAPSRKQLRLEAKKSAAAKGRGSARGSGGDTAGTIAAMIEETSLR